VQVVADPAKALTYIKIVQGPTPTITIDTKDTAFAALPAETPMRITA
jgi:hypothetical protein